MKFLGHKASVLAGTNKIISISNADWSAIREGSYFKFSNDNFPNIVTRIEKLMYVRDFEVEKTNKIKVRGNLSVDFIPGDEILITFKEWELKTVFKLENGGRGYNKGDLLIINDGIPSIDLVSDSKQFSQLQVEDVSESGTIIKYSINNNGKYIEKPEGNVFALNGGSGEGAVLSGIFDICDTRGSFERIVTQTDFDGNETTLVLNYSIPNSIKVGKFSCSKWSLTLAVNYPSTTKIGQSFDIIRDFSPFLDLPLMSKNSFAMDIIYNEAINKLDKKIKDLEEKIILLEKR